MRVFLKNNKIAIQLQSGDDFRSIIEKIKKSLCPYEYDNQTKLWSTEKMNLLIFDQIFLDDKIYYDEDTRELLKRQKDFLEQLNLNKEKIYEDEIPGLHDIKLFEHQKKAINFLLNYKSSGLFDEQGLGKTLSVIATISILFSQKKIDRVIVICPNTLKYNWEREINDFSQLECNVLVGNKKQKLEKLKENKQIYITNFESLILKETKNKSTKEISEQFLNRFKELVTKNTCIIIDEAHRIKSGNSKISKFIRKLGALTSYKYVLTGTPIANKPEDIFYLFKFLDGGRLLGTNYYKFLQQYCILGNGFSDYAIVGYKNLDKLRFLVEIMSLRRLKDDVLNLPEKLFEDRIIETSQEHISFYNDLKNDLLKKIEENTGEEINVESCLIRLIQAASNPILLDSQCNIESSKLKELDNLLEEHIEKSGNKVIIWTNFVNNFQYLLETYKKYNPLYINGSVSVEQRQENIVKFQSDEQTKLIICNPQACKEGITLTASNVSVYLDRSFNLVDYLQSVDRIHRIGQHKTCLIINLLCKDTIDEIVSKCIYRKSTLAAYIQGDIEKIERQISNQELLNLSLK